VNWNKELAAARSPEDVVALANRYFAAARGAFGERLPEGALPDAIADVPGLHAAQRRAVEIFMANPVYALDLEVQELCGFAIRALARALEVSENDRSAGPRREAIYRASSFDDRVEL
jgi:hypothetical protein